MIDISGAEIDLGKVQIAIGKDVSLIPLVLPLVKQAHKESYFADMPFDQEQYESMAQRAIDNPGYYGGLYVKYDEAPIAFAYYMLRPLLGSNATWITIMHSIYIRSDVRSTPLGGFVWNRIIGTVRAWSVPRGAKGMMFNAISGVAVEESDAVIRSAGATYLGGNYFMRI